MSKKKVYNRLMGWPDYTETFSAFQMFYLAWKELGESLMYMQYIHGDVNFGEQPAKVHKLCVRFSELYKHRHSNSKVSLERWRRLLSDIADEIENQC